MEILINFVDNSREYQVRYDNNIRYGYINTDNKFIDIEDNEELNLIKEIFMRVLPSRKLISIGKVRYKDKTYGIYVDRNNGYRLFMPNDEDVKDLYLLYNYDRDILYYNGKKRNDKYIKRMITIKNRMISVSISILILVYGSLLVSDNNYVRDNHFDMVVNVDTNNSEKDVLKKVQKKLDGNEKIDYQEKEFIFESIKIVIDDKNYYDWNYIYKILEDIEIKYVKKHNAEGALGSYNPFLKEIVCYGVNSFEEVDKGVLRHELRHALTKFKDNYNSFLVEVFTTIYNKDYYGEDSGYNQILHYGRALIEIIGEEPVKKYLEYTDTGNIEKELMKIIDDEEMAIKFLNNLDIYKDKILEGEYYYNCNIEFMHSLEYNIYEQYKQYYEAKYGRSMNNDLIMQYYLDRKMFEALIASNYYLPRDNESGEVREVLEKNYFNDDDKKELIVDYYVFEYREEKVGNNTVIRYVGDRYHNNIVIDDDNRYIGNKRYGII